jgi:RecA-family ATPase
LLKRLGRNHECAILLLAHPSLTGLNTGTGTSGSTGWSNAVRSRLYLQTAKASDGSDPNPNLRTLQGMKANYGPPGGKIDLEWKNGLFVPVQGATGLDKMAAEAKADDVFIAILKKFTAQNRACSPNPGPTYAPVMFASEPEAKGIAKAAFTSAMSRLLSANAIHIKSVGPPSHRRSRFALGEAPNKE